MRLFRKKEDPISARSKKLNAEISALEQEIRRLSSRPEPSAPKVRFGNNNTQGAAAPVAAAHSRPAAEPVFEHLDFRKNRSASDVEVDSSIGHFNDLGVRKYDLLGAFRRARSVFSPVAAENPKLVTYLAAGSVKGLKPLRYEKRVARNRFLFLSAIFVVILWGIAAAFFEYR